MGYVIMHRIALIHVSPRPGSDAWPIVERVAGGWQSGEHHYADADVPDVHDLDLTRYAPATEAELASSPGNTGSDAEHLRAQLEAVRALHQRAAYGDRRCIICREYSVWPCPTAQAVTDL